MKLVKGSIALASIAALILAFASVHLLGAVRVEAQNPSPTPALSYQSNASPPSGTNVNPTASPTFTYSLVISNVGETEVTPLIVHFDLLDVSPTLFSSTQGTCVWSDQPDDYHGASTGNCDLGTLPLSGGSSSSATITLNGTIFWNFYSHDHAQANVKVNDTPIAQGFTYPFGTPTPTSTAQSGSGDPVGGIAEMPDAHGSGSSGGECAPDRRSRAWSRCSGLGGRVAGEDATAGFEVSRPTQRNAVSGGRCGARTLPRRAGLRPSGCKASEAERCATDSAPPNENVEVIIWKMGHQE